MGKRLKMWVISLPDGGGFTADKLKDVMEELRCLNTGDRIEIDAILMTRKKYLSLKEFGG